MGRKLSQEIMYKLSTTEDVLCSEISTNGPNTSSMFLTSANEAEVDAFIKNLKQTVHLTLMGTTRI